MTITLTSTCDGDDHESDDVSHPYTSLNQGLRQMKLALRSKVIGDVIQCIQGDGYIKTQNPDKRGLAELRDVL